MPVAKLNLATTLVALLVATACGPTSTEPERFNPSGSLSFSYGGGISGTFQATGVMDSSTAGVLPTATAGATAVLRDSTVSLVAFQSRSQGRGDAFTLLLGQANGTGTVQMDPFGCQGQSAATCRLGVFVPDVSATELAAAQDPAALASKSYVIILGSVTITSRTQMRIRGTFSGTAVRADQQSLQGTLLISNGRFDLPIRS
jgi:hypothetical protein